MTQPCRRLSSSSSGPVLVTGASGLLGGYLLEELGRQATPAVAWSGSAGGAVAGVALRPVDLVDPDAVATAFRAERPSAVLHAAALTRVADCFSNPERARRVNVQGTRHLAALAGDTGVRLMLVSTDLVFDGARGWYTERDSPAPLSVYGQTKLAAERAVLAVPGAVVARVSLLYGPSHNARPGFFDQQAAALRERRPLQLFEDEWRTPLGLRTAARALAALVDSDVGGIVHIGGPERMSRLEMGRRLAAVLGCDASAIVPARREQAGAGEPRPCDTSLDPSRWRRSFPGLPWPDFEEALGEMT
jgi:dTDP-4-dehydrorhamnose reductase